MQTGAKENLSRKLWSYCSRVYEYPGVESECLRLQDESNLDVVLLLAAGFCSQYGLAWNRLIFGELKTESADLRRDFILPIRNMRRRAKNVATPAVYEALKSAELALERWQIDQVGERLVELRELDGETPEDMEGALMVCVPPQDRHAQELLPRLAALLNSAGRIGEKSDD